MLVQGGKATFPADSMKANIKGGKLKASDVLRPGTAPEVR